MAKYKKIIKKNSENLLIESFIELFVNYAKKKERQKKRFSFVLTGGPSPVKLYKKLSKKKINWKNIDLFWGDERFVPKKSKHSNFNLVHHNLLKNIKINKKQIYYINTNNNSALKSAYNYEKVLKRYFLNKKNFFDVILLGMGNDGHIASIFSNNLKEKTNKLVTNVTKKDFQRISLTLNSINKAKNIFLWLNNKKKTKVFKYLKGKKKIPVYYLKKQKMSIFLTK